MQTNIFNPKLQERFASFKGAEWFGTNLDITLVGLGSIGSWLALNLSRNGNHNIYAYEFDTFETKNLSGQFVQTKQVGKTKFDATKENLLTFSNFKNIFDMGKFEEDSLVNDVVMVGPDSIEVRKLVFNQWLQNPNRKVYLDGRMDFENFEIYCITPENEEFYKQSLFNSNGNSSKICSLSSTTHVAMTIGALMTGLLNNFLVSEDRVLPKYIKFNYITFIFEIQWT